jgi:hypothetical protein
MTECKRCKCAPCRCWREHVAPFGLAPDEGEDRT